MLDVRLANLCFPALLLASVAFASEPRQMTRPEHHVDGGFINPQFGPRREPSARVALPFFLRRTLSSAFGGQRPGAPAEVETDLVFLHENALGSVPSVTWVGHSTLLVQMGHLTFLTDPIWSRTPSPLPVGPKRYVDAPFPIDDLPRIDFVVISHNHYDHMDLPTLEALSNGHTRFLVPLGNEKTLTDAGIGPVEELDWWQTLTIGGVSIHCVPARHWSRRGLTDTNRALWSGWVVVADDRSFYFAGDTGWFDGFTEIGRRLGPIDLAAIPIGAYEPAAMMATSHLNPEEAVTAAVAIGAKRSLAVHFGTFDLSDEALDEPPARFSAASVRAGRGEEVDWLMAVGETRLW